MLSGAPTVACAAADLWSDGPADAGARIGAQPAQAGSRPHPHSPGSARRAVSRKRPLLGTAVTSTRRQPGSTWAAVPAGARLGAAGWSGHANASVVAGGERHDAPHSARGRACGREVHARDEGFEHKLELERREWRTEAAVRPAAEGKVGVGAGRVAEKPFGTELVGVGVELRVAVDSLGVD